MEPGARAMGSFLATSLLTYGRGSAQTRNDDGGIHHAPPAIFPQPGNLGRSVRQPALVFPQCVGRVLAALLTGDYGGPGGGKGNGGVPKEV